VDQELAVPQEEARMFGSQSQVWVADQDGRVLIRADTIVAVGHGGGRVTARLAGANEPEVLLAAGSDDAPVPDDFHRQLIRAVTESDDTGGAHLIRAHPDGGWRWVTGPV
jgi:hypothetical protein